MRPPDADALIDEATFDEDEFLPYWAELWPSGLALARYVSELELAGRKVLEQLAPAAVRGKASVEHRASGLVWELRAPQSGFDGT